MLPTPAPNFICRSSNVTIFGDEGFKMELGLIDGINVGFSLDRTVAL